MQRKLIRLAKSTLVVSLPLEWIKRNGLKKGEAVELIDKERELVLFPKTRKAKNNFEVDVRGFDDRLLKRVILACYKHGFQELSFLCSSDQMGSIEKNIEQFLGILLMEKRENKVMIKNVIGGDEVDFFAIFKKTFFLFDYHAEDALRKILKKEKGSSAEIAKNKENFLKHIHLSLFLLQEQGVRTIREANVYFTVLSLLDAIGDLYFRLCNYLLEGRQDHKEIAFLKRITSFLHKIYLAYFSEHSIKELYAIRSDLYPKHPERTANMMLLSVIAKLMLELVECRITLGLIENNAK